MKRRDFVALSGMAGAGALASLGASYADTASLQEARHLPGSIADLQRREPPPGITETERAERRARAQGIMAEQGIVATFIEPGPSLDYFADVSWGRSERVFGMLLPARGDAIFISPAFEEQRAELGVDGRFEIRAWQEDESPYALMADAIRGWGYTGGRVAVDPSARVFVFEGLAHVMAPGFETVSAAPVVHGTRGVKTAHEIQIMRFANRITLDAFEAAFRSMEAGMTQSDLASNVSRAMQRLGYGGGALVLFGGSSAYPHGAPNPEPLGDGSMVLVDGGLSVHGYRSDNTRTVCFGSPPPEAEEVFAVVKEAQQVALRAARPGIPAGNVDLAARSFITDEGYGPGYRLFTHRLGHGIGLEGHEWPYLVKDSTINLWPGMTFSDEPGIYQYGKFGIRLEDIMAITEDGAELMTEPATELVRYG